MTCPSPEKLSGALDAELETHIDSCAACRQVMSALARDAGAPAPSFGRYRLEHVLGSGGMGIVYRAWDPELARAVAIKVVKRLGDDPAGGARLAREAQSLARLSHRNVCQVYDVGTEGDEVWVAMELIDGATLRAWAVDQPRAAVLDVLLQTAEGLAAAHAAGVIHRDVKPENVLVARDGHAVVSDFGLARIEQGAMLPTNRGDNLTGAGAIAGTPAYLAPEQLAGDPVDARVDQFAWAVMAWELLVGSRPFPAELDARAQAVRAGVSAPAGVPRALGAALVRALAADPAARFPTLTNLIDAIRGAQRRKRAFARYGLSGAAAVALAGAAFLARTHDDPADVCERSALRLDAVWNPARAVALRMAFATTPTPIASDTAERTIRVFDTFGDQFVSQTRDACRATFASGQASQKAFDVRKQCLDRGLERVTELLALFARPDVELVTRAINAAHAVSDVEACRDATSMLTVVDEPADPRVREQIGQLRARLARADALDDAGQPKPSLALATELDAAAQTIDYAPLRAEIALRLGIELRTGENNDAAEAAFRRAVQAAEAGRDDRTATYAWIRLASAARAKGAYDEATRAIDQATAKLTRIGDPPEALGFLLVNKAMIEQARDDLAAARVDFEHSLAVYDSIGADQPRVIGVLTPLAHLYGSLGLPDLALQTAQRAEALAEKIRGPEHPQTAEALEKLGAALASSGQRTQAIAAVERAVAIDRAVFGADSNVLASALNTLAGVRFENGDLDGAAASLGEAISIRSKLFGADHPSMLRLESNLGLMLVATRPKDALPHLEHALAGTVRVNGADSADAADLYINLAEAHTATGAFAEARANATKARDVLTAKLGPKHPKVAVAAFTLGQVELADHHPAAAIAPLEQAVAIASLGQSDPIDAAEDQFALAQAVWPTNRPRAISLATAARTAAAKVDGATAERAKYDAWLAAHAK